MLDQFGEHLRVRLGACPYQHPPDQPALDDLERLGELIVRDRGLVRVEKEQHERLDDLAFHDAGAVREQPEPVDRASELPGGTDEAPVLPAGAVELPEKLGHADAGLEVGVRLEPVEDLAGDDLLTGLAR